LKNYPMGKIDRAIANQLSSKINSDCIEPT
jgi:hypothetical protein